MRLWVFPTSPSPPYAPLVRCSCRLAPNAELTGGRKVHCRDDRRLKPSVFHQDNFLIPLADFFGSVPLFRVSIKTKKTKHEDVTISIIVTPEGRSVCPACCLPGLEKFQKIFLLNCVFAQYSPPYPPLPIGLTKVSRKLQRSGAPRTDPEYY